MIEIFRVDQHVAFRGELDKLSKGDYVNLGHLFLALEACEKLKTR